MKHDTMGPWALFLGGRWTRVRPVRPGVYPVATLDGDVLDPEKYKVLDEAGRQKGVRFGEPGWLGYWWSQPLPPMPHAPKRGRA